MNKIELLAPAGSMESLIAAINNGADAIYLGGSKFSARAYASNFDNETMMKAVDYAHSYNVKVYVTMNTLLKQNELKEALKYVGYLVLTHMGQWNLNYSTGEIFAPKPQTQEQMFVHLCDYLASRKCLEMNFDIPYSD